MNRRAWLASVLGVAVAACTRKTRHLHLGYDPGKPGADHAVLVMVPLVMVPPRHMMTSHVHVRRIEVLGADPDAFVRAFNEHTHNVSGNRSA